MPQEKINRKDMSAIYFFIVVFLLCLAVFDLFVGVSNDAVNFLQSAIGARVAKFRTILFIASVGVILGAVMSTGMMDVARHGILTASEYSFHEVMTIFLAVIVTDVIILDIFNSFGMPTSTTVSMVFELLGGTFILATIKKLSDSTLEYGMLLNSGKALEVIIAIFVSVAISFVVGVVVMWISRIIFTFNYKRHSRYTIALFGGVAFTALSYFIFLKGIGQSPYVSEEVSGYVNANIRLLLLATLVGSTIIMQILHLCRVNIFRFIVLMGTFGLAMSFAGNDLVNFIGVPLAGLDSYQTYVAHAFHVSPDQFMMTSLMKSSHTPVLYLFIAGCIMVIAMATSKKSHKVIKTSVDLSRQDEGEEMFGSSRAARSIVRFSQEVIELVVRLVPSSVRQWINRRFAHQGDATDDQQAAFDVVRAAVNLVLASILITIGTNYKLPLSTTYVTFMVAMGSSLADRAWSRESAVFRVTGVLSVIGGWFLTAGVAFLATCFVCVAMYYGGFIVQVGFIILVVVLLIRSNRNYNKKQNLSDKERDTFQLMMRMHDPDLVWDVLQKQVSRTQSSTCLFALAQYNLIVDAFRDQDVKSLRRSDRQLRLQTETLKKTRRREMLALKRVPMKIAIERNTWFHIGANSDQQLVYTLRRMLNPIKEHVDNNFNPVPELLIREYEPIRRRINDLMQVAADQIQTDRYENYREILAEGDACKDELSIVRKRHINRMQQSADNTSLQVDMVYLNLLQESQQLLSNMRHQLRSAKKFMEKY